MGNLYDIHCNEYNGPLLNVTLPKKHIIQLVIKPPYT